MSSVARPASDISDRLPPQNLDAERGVLGSILLWNDAIDEVAEFLHADHFYGDAHRRIYAAIHLLHERGIRGIDAVALRKMLNEQLHTKLPRFLPEQNEETQA